MSPMVRLPITTELALLGFLNINHMHGYEIHRRMSDPSGLGQVWRIKQSQLYALLGKLEEAGYIVSKLEPQDSKPPRKVYRLTPQGKDTFQDWVKKPVDKGRAMRLDFLVKFYFARLQGLKVSHQLVDQQSAVCQQWLKSQQALNMKVDKADTYKWLICQFRHGQIKAMHEWITICKQVLDG